MATLALENFEFPSTAPIEPSKSGQAEAEIARATGFEQGYKAGWDDAVRSENDAREHLDAELARNLEELSFSYFEAQRQVSLSLRELLTSMADLVFPKIYEGVFEKVLDDLLSPLISETCNLTVELNCAPETIEIVRGVMARNVSLPISIVSESSFSKHQVKLKLDHEVHEIDGDALLREIQTIMGNSLVQLAEDLKNVS